MSIIRTIKRDYWVEETIEDIDNVIKDNVKFIYLTHKKDLSRTSKKFIIFVRHIVSIEKDE